MFDQKKKDISREELYELVWANSMKTVGEMFNVSDTAVRKKCKLFNIPLPDNRYRGKMQAGQNPEKVPLPLREGYNIVSFQESNFTTKKSEPEKEKNDFGYLEDPLRSKVVSLYNTLTVPEDKVRNHKLVTAYIEEIAERKRHQKKNKYGYGYSYDSRKQMPTLDFGNVTNETLPRAYKIISILLKALEEIGCTVGVQLNEPSIINIRGMQIAFRFKEKCSRVTLEKQKDSWGPTSDLVPNGKLSFAYGIYSGRGYSSYSETEVVDTDTTKIEDKISVIFKRIVDLSQAQIERIAEIKEQERIEELERLERERLKKIRDDEIDRVKSLIQDCAIWEKAKSIRDYIKALEANMGEDISDEGIEYIRWVRKKADWMDPTMDTEDEILNAVEEEDDILPLLIPKEKKSSINRYW